MSIFKEGFLWLGITVYIVTIRGRSRLHFTEEGLAPIANHLVS